MMKRTFGCKSQTKALYNYHMHKDIIAYNNAVESPVLKAVCERLEHMISAHLPQNATAKIHYAIPIWFINDNPIVGYNVTKKNKVNLLFWSGQSFKEPGLSPEGSFKAAEIKYADPREIDEQKLKKWLKEAATTMWNYRDIRKNKGKMSLL